MTVQIQRLRFDGIDWNFRELVSMCEASGTNIGSDSKSGTSNYKVYYKVEGIYETKEFEVSYWNHNSVAFKIKLVGAKRTLYI